MIIFLASLVSCVKSSKPVIMTGFCLKKLQFFLPFYLEIIYFIPIFYLNDNFYHLLLFIEEKTL